MSARSPEIELYGPQWDFMLAPEHYLAFVGGVGSGKTVAGCARGLAAALGSVGEAKIRTPNLGVITAPTYPMLRDATLRVFLEMAAPFIADYNKSEMRVTLRNGSEIIFRSTDNAERLRGPSVSWWYGDEAALYSAKTWQIMLGRLRQYGQHGYAWLTTTPKGRNWVWQKFVQAGRAGYRLVKASTLLNPYLHPEFIAGLVEEYAGDFAAQELHGEFVAFEGLIYAEFDRTIHMSQRRPESFKTVVAGVDWGYQSPGVILIAGVDEDGRKWGLHEEYRRQRQIDEWADVAKELRDVYGVERFFCDPSEPKYIDKFVERGCKAEAADNSVLPGIQLVKRELIKRTDGLPRLIIPPGWVWAASEFEQYQWQENRRDGGFADSPLKVNDHAMDALRYLIMGVDGKKRRSDVTVSGRRVV